MESCYKIYGISQHPDTKDYIIVCPNIFFNGNRKIDNFIKEMQLKRRSYYDMIFEWIPYSQFNNVKEMSKGDFATIYSAIWKDGPLYYDNLMKEYVRKSDKKVALKCLLYNSQNLNDEFLNEV